MELYTGDNKNAYVLEEFFYNIWEYLEEKDRRSLALGISISIELNEIS